MWSTLTIFLVLIVFLFTVTWMPGKSYQGVFKPLNEIEESYRLALEKHVRVLAHDIGVRSGYRYDKLKAAEEYLSNIWSEAGLDVKRQEFLVSFYPNDPKPVANIFVELKGVNNDSLLVVGAHYDSVMLDTPGANDNASGVAAVLELALRLKDIKPQQTIQFVLFVNEEPPFFQTKEMGSLVYAKSLRVQGRSSVRMISLETIGYYSDEPQTQKYPFPLSLLYPDTGNFIGIVGNMRSGSFVREVITIFRNDINFPSEGIAAPSFIPGIAWSDQWSFWKQGYQAIMVTDTAPFRYPYYHLQTDTYEKLNYEHFARVVYGFELIIKSLVRKS
jgi:hypothetical protein